jgi:hypothetical protein
MAATGRELLRARAELGAEHGRRRGAGDLARAQGLRGRIGQPW